MWIDPNAPEVNSFIVTGVVDPDYAPDPVDISVEAAVSLAIEILAGLTGGKVHPAGTATEKFRASPAVHRLVPGRQPLIAVNSVIINEEPVDATYWEVSGNAIFFKKRLNYLAPSCWGLTSFDVYVGYNYGSTITSAARKAVLEFARQIWLFDNPEAGQCLLPARLTSINREGVSYTIIDPMTFIEKGQTGLAVVDLWVHSVNPTRSGRRPGVYTPDAPIGTYRRVIDSVYVPETGQVIVIDGGDIDDD